MKDTRNKMVNFKNIEQFNESFDTNKMSAPSEGIKEGALAGQDTVSPEEVASQNGQNIDKLMP